MKQQIRWGMNILHSFVFLDWVVFIWLLLLAAINLCGLRTIPFQFYLF
ncbi:unnamed protein product [Brassica rapa subsp. trilocularis]